MTALFVIGSLLGIIGSFADTMANISNVDYSERLNKLKDKLNKKIISNQEALNKAIDIGYEIQNKIPSASGKVRALLEAAKDRSSKEINKLKKIDLEHNAQMSQLIDAQTTVQTTPGLAGMYAQGKAGLPDKINKLEESINEK